MASKRKPIELHPVHNRSEFNQFFRTLWNGEPPELVGKSAITGRYSLASVKSKVTKRINEIIEDVDNFKIGVMGDTLARMDGKDYRKKFEYVSRVYKTASKEVARNYEVELIKKYKKSHPDQIENISEAKAGRLTTYNGFYYVYVVFNLPEEED